MIFAIIPQFMWVLFAKVYVCRLIISVQGFDQAANIYFGA